ncbi:hypothetical protein TH61_05115 [Rufibacter sp. DG15C]|uniref:DUF4926 domain-containing protein n=1 Tax=Rufibacter sp. DG15C TaxID=1379909 RepID=UPI00078E7C0A|nr:DUF4926 domain-containing protein [Rufibacter sp. DG15C]AMM50681.1 hypothetical protein TH61_05115 [Rufibacter sp. DG15C]
MEIKQYDVVELTEDINPNLKKGMHGAVLEKYNEDAYEIEVIDKNGNTLSFGTDYTFTVNKKQIAKI